MIIRYMERRERSLPPRERGLKHKRDRPGFAVPRVAPPAGAWIETALSFYDRGLIQTQSLPPRERGLKQLSSYLFDL